jgi:hypothetical protein
MIVRNWVFIGWQNRAARFQGGEVRNRAGARTGPGDNVTSPSVGYGRVAPDTLAMNDNTGRIILMFDRIGS